MAKALVTGATGFIGRQIVPQLIEAGIDVVDISRHGKFAIDLHDRDAVRRVVEKERPQYLLHLAWNVDRGYMENPENLDWVISSLELLKAFSDNGGQRAVFAGSCIEYNWQYGFLSEDLTPLESDSLYGTSKAALYRLATAYARQRGLSFAWGRVFFLYGKGEKEDRLIPSLIEAFSKGESPKLKYPHIFRDYMHVYDVAGAFVAILKSSFNGAVNIASGKAIALSEIAQTIARLMGKPTPAWDQESEGGVAPLVVGDTRRLSGMIGFKPRISWEEGLRKVIQERESAR